MPNRHTFLAITLILGGCATAGSPPPSFDKRPLTSIEKESLRRSLSLTLKDPDTAQFKWLPAVVPKPDAAPNAPTGYCGLVNGRNSYGGYTGFKRFYAT